MKRFKGFKINHRRIYKQFCQEYKQYAIKEGFLLLPPHKYVKIYIPNRCVSWYEHLEQNKNNRKEDSIENVIFPAFYQIKRKMVWHEINAIPSFLSSIHPPIFDTHTFEVYGTA